MLILMRETESGKLWPYRLFENHDAWVYWLDALDGETDLLEDSVYTYHLIEGCFYESLYHPKIVGTYTYDTENETFLPNTDRNRCWHADGDWW